ncbi:MAG: diguanylate cyclase domain-containing protein [Lachnospiraceae bacterium]
MPNRTKEKKYNTILVVLVIIIIGILMIYTYVSNIQMEKYARYSVEENVKKISNEVDAYIDSALNSIQLTSHLVTQSMDQRVLEDAGAVLEAFVEQTPFSFIEYIDQNGINTTNMGERFDASNREYYIKGIEGETGIWVNFNPKYSQEYLLNFYTPLYYDDEIAGVLTGAMGSKTDMLPLLKNSFLGEEMIGILCDGKGRIISATFETEGEIYWKDVLDGLGVSEEDRQVFYDHAIGNDSGVFEFTEKNGKAIASVSVNERTGWRVIQIVTPAYFRTVMKHSIGGAYVMTILISVMLILFLIYVRIDSGKKHREDLKEKDTEVQDYAQILTATASDISKGIRRIDLETGQTDYLYFEDQHLKKKEIGDWTAWVESQKQYVYPGDYIRLKKFACMENLSAMKEGNTYHVYYRSAKKKENGYFSHYYSTASLIYVNGRKTIIMTTIDNTESVVSAIEQKQLLASAASIYISMHSMDIKNDTLETLSCAEHVRELYEGKTDNMRKRLRETMEKLTSEPYRDAMMKFIDFDTLDERMKGTNTISMEFVGNVSGWCRARFIAVDYDKEGKLSRVLWAVESIDAEKKKETLLLYLSETDLMTGIRNRGSGEKKIKELIDSGREGTFFLLDVDKFKSINDIYGHNIGDKVLIAVADSLKNSFQNSDVVMRLGGDEFAVFACDILEEGIAVSRIENFFRSIEEIDIPELGEHKIYISLGAAFKRRDDGEDFDSLYRDADSCTYESKKTQGNTYTFHK